VHFGVGSVGAHSLTASKVFIIIIIININIVILIIIIIIIIITSWIRRISCSSL
jgi:hypothetical protein